MTRLTQKARITEVDALSDSLITLYQAASALADDTFLQGAFAQLAQLSASITTAIKQSAAVSTLDEADTARDDAIRSLSALLKGYRAFPQPAKRQAAEAVSAVFEKYGVKITKESYANQSSLTESLLEDLAAPALSAPIAALDGVADSIAAVRSAQDAFAQANAVYVQASVNKGESASSYKKPIVALINDKIAAYLSTMTMVDAERYATFAAQVEKEITRTNAAVAKRSAK